MPPSDLFDRVIEKTLNGAISAILAGLAPFFSWIHGSAFGQDLFQKLQESLGVELFPPVLKISKDQSDLWTSVARDNVLAQLKEIHWYAVPLPILFAAVLLHVLFKRFRKDHASNRNRIVQLYVRYYYGITIGLFASLLILALSVTSLAAYAWVMFTILLSGCIYILLYSKDVRGQTFGDVATYALVAIAFILAVVETPTIYAQRFFNPKFFVVSDAENLDPLSVSLLIDPGSNPEQAAIGVLKQNQNGTVRLEVNFRKRPSASKDSILFRTFVENLKTLPPPPPTVVDAVRDSIQQKLATAQVVR